MSGSRRSTIRDGLSNKVETYALTHFPDLWGNIQERPGWPSMSTAP